MTHITTPLWLELTYVADDLAHIIQKPQMKTIRAAADLIKTQGDLLQEFAAVFLMTAKAARDEITMDELKAWVDVNDPFKKLTAFYVPTKDGDQVATNPTQTTPKESA